MAKNLYNKRGCIYYNFNEENVISDVICAAEGVVSQKLRIAEAQLCVLVLILRRFLKVPP